MNITLSPAENGRYPPTQNLTYERTILHTLFIYDIAAQRELANNIGTPLSKLSSTDRVDTITNRNDCVKILELCHVVLTICSSCRVFLGN